MNEQKLKILVAKPGLDGHDRGAKIIALALRDAGMDVIYTGLHKSIEQIVETAKQESVDIIGLSIMSGAHLSICENLLDVMQSQGMADTGIIVGGVIPAHDIPKLKQMGIKGIYPGGTPLDDVIDGIRGIFVAG